MPESLLARANERDHISCQDPCLFAQNGNLITNFELSPRTRSCYQGTSHRFVVLTLQKRLVVLVRSKQHVSG